MKRETLNNTLEPVIRATDIMNKYGVSKGTALRILKINSELHSYYLGNALVCERQYFDAFVNKMNDCGGSITLS